MALDSHLSGFDIPALIPHNNHTEEGRCFGTHVLFGGEMFVDYPWHMHSKGGLPYCLGYIDPAGHFFYAQSLKCTGCHLLGGFPCDACSQVVTSQPFREVMYRASLGNSALPTSLNTQYHTYSQVCKELQEKTKQLNTYKLQVGVVAQFWCFCVS